MKKVLIVDDEPNLVVSLEYLMKWNGYQVSIARDGEEALQETARFHPDLILLDVMLPLRDGFEVCQTIRENPAWQEIKIILLSARGRAVEIAKGLAVGANAYVTKPFSTTELVETVREALGEEGDVAEP